MYCKHCGKEIADDSKFCQHCGKILVERESKDYVQLAIAFLTPNTTIKKMAYSLFAIAMIALVWYYNCDSRQIVGEWRRDIRFGTEINIFNADNTWESKIESAGFCDTSVEGTWKIEGDLIITSFVDKYSGKRLSDESRIVKLTSDSLVLENGTNHTLERFIRCK